MDRRSRGTRKSSKCFQICVALSFLFFMFRSSGDARREGRGADTCLITKKKATPASTRNMPRPLKKMTSDRERGGSNKDADVAERLLREPGPKRDERSCNFLKKEKPPK